MFDYSIVGAGYAGCALPERIASQLDRQVLIVEKRNHIGGRSQKIKKSFFIGRLANYKYYNMDEVVSLALELFETRIGVNAR